MTSTVFFSPFFSTSTPASSHELARSRATSSLPSGFLHLSAKFSTGFPSSLFLSRGLLKIPGSVSKNERRAGVAYATAATEKSLYNFSVKDIDGKDVPLNKFKGKILLIVNVASRCGLTTSNYTELSHIYEKYKTQGFEILAFPCNQFGGQEPGSNSDIKQFACTRFKAEFPIFDKRLGKLLSLSMGNTSSMLTQYDIEEVQEHCNHAFSQQEIVSLYHRFCQLDRNSGGFVSADEFLSVPEFAVNPLSQRLLRMLDGLNFKEFVAFLSAFSPRTSLRQKIEFIFKVYDLDCNGKVTFNDILSVLRDLTGSFMTEQQRQKVLTHVLEEAGYTNDSSLVLSDFIKILGNSDLKMDVEVPVD